MLDATPIVYVVDGDPSVHDSVEGLIKGEGLRVEHFSSAMAFLSRQRTHVPGCLILDVKLPDLNGLALQSRIAFEHNVMPVIFIASCRDVRTIVSAMKAGAHEFLAKPFETGELLNAIRTAIERSGSVLAQEAGLLALRERYGTLSPREKAVIAMVASGHLNKQVGGVLGISEFTVKAHRGRAMRKMQADSLAQLVDMARRLGLPLAPKVNGVPRVNGVSRGDLAISHRLGRDEGISSRL